MKTVLIPTDFSSNAYRAMHYATHLFASEKCTFILMHSFEYQVTNLTSRIDIGKTEALVDELYTKYEAKCEREKNRIIVETQNGNHNFRTIVTSLSLSRAIDKLIVKESVDFVTMGSKGSTASRDLLVGSNTLKMIKKIKNAPLLVIPNNISFDSIKKIAFATGLKRTFKENELQPLSYLSKLHKTKIRVIHVLKEEEMSEIQRKNFQQLLKIFKENEPKGHWVPKESNVYQAITTNLRNSDINLVAMIYYKHNKLAQWFREATIKDLAKYTLIPFLILPVMD